MEVQPLKTIPEETAAPTTAKTPDRVTSDVPKTKPATAKHPGRVPSGERLAERNRLASEAKKQAEAQKPPTNSATNSINSTTDQSSSSSPNTTNNTSAYLILKAGGLIVSALGVYYQREAIIRTLGQSPKTQTTQSTPSSTDVASPPPPAIAKAPKRKNREME